MIKPNTLDKKKDDSQSSGFGIFRHTATIIAIATVLFTSYGYTWKVSAAVEKIQTDTTKNTQDVQDIQKKDEEYDKKLNQQDINNVSIKDSISSINEYLKRIEQSGKETNNKLDDTIKAVNTMESTQSSMSTNLVNIQRSIDKK